MTDLKWTKNNNTYCEFIEGYQKITSQITTIDQLQKVKNDEEIEGYLPNPHDYKMAGFLPTENRDMVFDLVIDSNFKEKDFLKLVRENIPMGDLWIILEVLEEYKIKLS